MTRIVLILAFIVSFAAGLIVGLEFRQPATAAPATRPFGRSSFLAADLNLTAEQQEQMKKIWSDTAHRGGRDQEDRRRQYRKERDDAIVALIRPEEKEKYDSAVKTYAERMSAMEKERLASFQSAVEKTKQILNPEQLKKYEEFLKRHGPGARDQERRADSRATSRPVTIPTSLPGVAPR